MMFGLLFLWACATVDNTKVVQDDLTIASETLSSTKISEAQINKDDKICKGTKVAGSNFRKDMCATEEEWALMKAKAQNTTQTLQRYQYLQGIK